MTARERLRKAIDDMAKTEVCLDIFDKALSQARAEAREAAAECAEEHECKSYHDLCDCRAHIARAIRQQEA